MSDSSRLSSPPPPPPPIPSAATRTDKEEKRANLERVALGTSLYSDGYTNKLRHNNLIVAQGRIIRAALLLEPYKSAQGKYYHAGELAKGQTRNVKVWPTLFVVLWEDLTHFEACMITNQQPERMTEAVRAYNVGERFEPQQNDEVCAPVVVGMSNWVGTDYQFRLEGDSFVSLVPSILSRKQWMMGTGAMMKGEDFLRLKSACRDFLGATPVAPVGF